MHPFLIGLLAGYGIAIPVGAIAVLIFDAGLRRGLKVGMAAGAGAAAADFLYAALAARGGRAILGGVELEGWTGAIEFVAGAGLASLSWHWLLAGLGALGRKALPPRGQAAAIWIGNLIVAGLGLRLLLGRG